MPFHGGGPKPDNPGEMHLGSNRCHVGRWERILFCVFGLLATAWAAPGGELNLVPWPAEVTPQPGHFVINNATTVSADPAFTHEAARLADELHLRTGPAGTNGIRLTRDGAGGLPEEGYRLEVDPNGVTLHAAAAAGAFYGGQTLRQLLEPDTRSLPGVRIADAPRYAWRGLMLDVSRHFFEQATVLQLLDRMADYKLNRFHLHLTDDQAWRLVIDRYPELTRAGARGNFSDTNAPARFFTKAEMREIIAYAAERHIVVVPEIDMPGHAGAATRTFPQLDGGDSTFNPAREATYDFLQNVLTEVMQTFPSPWIHFGGDEVKLDGWKHNPEVAQKLQREGLTNALQLEGEFVRRMAGFIQKHGRTPVGWDDVITAGAGRDTVVFWWRHDRPKVLVDTLAAGYQVVLTPRAPFYFDYPQDKQHPNNFAWRLVNTPEDVYHGPNLPAELSPAEQKRILGVEGCVWTERITTPAYLEFMTLPRLAALAEMAWTPDGERDYHRFTTRLKPRLERYRSQGIHFYDASDPQGSLRAARAAANDPQHLTEIVPPKS